MNNRIRWGILGTGNIARKFAEALQNLPDAKLVAVGSRTADAANAFADDFDIAHRHADYAALANDPEVDVIYVASPHSHHVEHAMLCLNAGKAVLCEKAFTINAREAEQVIQTARERGLFLMEAMWTRFMPAVVEARRLVADGVIGRPVMVQADLGVRFEVDAQHRLLNPHLGGGALLDLGIYPISFASFFLGAINKVAAVGSVGATEVDDNIAISMHHASGAISVATATLHAHTPCEALIVGTHGQIRVHEQFYKSTAITIAIDGEESRTLRLPYAGNGYQAEAQHVMDCMRQGRTESSVMPLDETLAIMRALDTIREQIGMKYPKE